MGVPVVEDWWVSLRKRPPKLLMVALVVKAMMGKFVCYKAETGKDELFNGYQLWYF